VVTIPAATALSGAKAMVTVTNAKRVLREDNRVIEVIALSLYDDETVLR
jgi:hypothetical protein